MKKRAFLKALAVTGIALSSVFGAPASVLASDYPDRLINIIVPFPPGGLTDIIGRRFADYLQRETGQTVVVQNRAGASGQVGAQYVSRQPADGYTLLVTATHFGISAAIRTDLPYNPVTDFSPIALFVTTPNILVVNKDVPVTNIQEYIAYANGKAQGISVGSSGTGGSTHLSGELLKFRASANMHHIPYKGMTPHVNDLVGGQIESGFVDPSSVMQFLADGRLRAIGVTGAQRFDILPDVPTISEQGIDGYEATTWIALVAPAGTPQAIQDFLNKAAIASMQTPSAKQFLKQISAMPSDLSPSQFTDYLRHEISKWSEVADAANLKIGN